MNNKNTKQNVHLTIRRGDVLLINYGSNDTGCRNGIIPSVVIGSEDLLKKERSVLVVPLYRHETRAFKAKDVLIKTTDCIGLRYDEYAQPLQVKAVKKCRVVKKIGHIKDELKVNEITAALQEYTKGRG